MTEITSTTLNYYNQNADSFIQGTVSVDFSQVQDKFLERLNEGDYILDFGCGSGRDTKYFLKKGNNNAKRVCIERADMGFLWQRFFIFQTGCYSRFKGIISHGIGSLNVFSLRHAFWKIRKGNPKPTFFSFVN